MTGPLSHSPDIEHIERQTLSQLAQLKDNLMALKELPARGAHGQIAQQYASQLEQMAADHRQRKQDRDRKRTHYHHTLTGEALAKALDTLKRESQHDSSQQRHLKQKRKQALAPLATAIIQADQQIQDLKHQYTTLSQQWQAQLQTALCR